MSAKSLSSLFHSSPALRASLRISLRVAGITSLFAVAAGLQACGGDDDDSTAAAPAPAPAPTALTCDDSMKTAFAPDASTSVLLVKKFAKGDALTLGTAASNTPVATNDVCMVKLLVGPGNPGPASAPSTSPGIGIEIWLPATANWNKKIHNMGGGGWAGGTQTSLTAIGSTAAGVLAGTEGAVVSSSDGGHPGSDGDFLMNPDGSINTALWTDFASRAMHQMAIESKALVSAYYLEPQKFAYFDGCSTGGRQAMNLAQNFPTDYNGIVAGAPAVSWVVSTSNKVYSTLVVTHDLGGTPPTTAQAALVGGSAVSACDIVGGQHLGYILDPSACKYDPTKDAGVLCAGAVSNGVTGTNATAACVSPVQAAFFNKTWYGPTPDGSVPDPAADNGFSPTLTGSQIWYGPPRGATLGSFIGAAPSSNPLDQIALDLQDPTYANASFINAVSNGQNKWTTMGYAQLANAVNQGEALQTFFGNIDSSNPDLSAFRKAGGKLVMYHGLSDTLISPWGSVKYYTQIANLAGGYNQAQQFDRMFLIPGTAHCSGLGNYPGVAGPVNTVNNVPQLDAQGVSATGATQTYAALTDWVENGNAPASLTLSSKDGSASRPVCPYPSKATYVGPGSPTVAASYACQ